ncbi:MAG: U32 family peptidase, partial [Rhodospirillales bacterium]|nr:U32 family peptidase [Rhodospirillales bacterium]
ASYLFEDPVSLNAASILPELTAAGVTGLKIEGRQRGKAYIAEVVSSFRHAVDSLADGMVEASDLTAIAEGQRKTSGAYDKTWR